jgi:hypothetical protein
MAYGRGLRVVEGIMTVSKKGCNGGALNVPRHIRLVEVQPTIR